MRVPVGWLRSYCDPGLPTEGLAERLTVAGLEVQRIERTGVGAADAFVVGKVLAVERHPHADRLTVCEVEDGSGSSRTIVCGAPNVSSGQTVAVARPGATMPDGSKLQEAELRGVTSSGMILAEDELGIGDDHEGIIVLPGDLPAGAALADHLPIADEVLDLEVNPNRPDALGVYGVARDLHAVTGAPLAEDPTETDAPASGEGHARDHVSLEIADPEICLRFTARVFEDVKPGASPPWLKQRLMAAGQRPISNVVDITNYVMLLTGQPLHAFDLDEVRGSRIVVRRAHDGERMTTLDDVERVFDSDIALVCDAEGPSGIAGIMGGRISEVSPKTTRVLMEVATWVGPNILRTSKKLALRSEASTRFEKQLHPDQAMAAQHLAAKLMVDLCGARMVPGTLDEYQHPAEPRTLALRLARLEQLLGERVPPDEVVAILDRLGFEPSPDNGRVAATVPSWRDSDVQREADLIEEVARVHGLDKLPTTLPARRRAIGRLTPAQRLRRRLEDALRDRGLLEVVAYSFTAPAKIAWLRLDEEPLLEIANPLSEDQTVMRPLLLPGLLDAAAFNAARGRTGLGLFESAHVYEPAGAAPGGVANGGLASPAGARPAAERHHLGGLITESAPGGWRSEARPADYYGARALVEGVLGASGLEWWAEPGARPFLHPGRAASVYAAGGQEIGWIGELHPLVVRDWELPVASSGSGAESGIAAFELDVDALAARAPAAAAYRDVTSFPAVRQDIAAIVPEGVSAAELEAAVRAGAGELLRSARVFDLYRGEQVGEGNKSLALRLEFGAPDRTLTDADVAERRVAIEQSLARLGGRLRA